MFDPAVLAKHAATLLPHIEDPDSSVRWAVVNALGKLWPNVLAQAPYSNAIAKRLNDVDVCPPKGSNACHWLCSLPLYCAC